MHNQRNKYEYGGYYFGLSFIGYNVNLLQSKTLNYKMFTKQLFVQGPSHDRNVLWIGEDDFGCFASVVYRKKRFQGGQCTKNITKEVLNTNKKKYNIKKIDWRCRYENANHSPFANGIWHPTSPEIEMVMKFYCLSKGGIVHRICMIQIQFW